MFDGVGWSESAIHLDGKADLRSALLSSGLHAAYPVAKRWSAWRPQARLFLAS